LCKVHDLHLVSQTWQNIKWEHQLQVYVPTGVKPTETIVLWNQGGTAGPAVAVLNTSAPAASAAPATARLRSDWGRVDMARGFH
jgi:PhoPQ-activated pathogenicity-related protein